VLLLLLLVVLLLLLLLLMLMMVVQAQSLQRCVDHATDRVAHLLRLDSAGEGPGEAACQPAVELSHLLV